jgi:hypothetical protein
LFGAVLADLIDSRRVEMAEVPGFRVDKGGMFRSS